MQCQSLTGCGPSFVALQAVARGGRASDRLLAGDTANIHCRQKLSFGGVRIRATR